jgi:hypothetical protein
LLALSLGLSTTEELTLLIEMAALKGKIFLGGIEEQLESVDLVVIPRALTIEGCERGRRGKRRRRGEHSTICHESPSALAGLELVVRGVRKGTNWEEYTHHLVPRGRLLGRGRFLWGSIGLLAFKWARDGAKNALALP